MTTPLNTWISVKDAMPEHTNVYEFILIVIDHGGDVFHCGYNDRYNEFITLTGDTKVVHPNKWMLLSKQQKS
jgi:hypothetical protein